MNLPTDQVDEAIKYRQEALQREHESKQKERAPGNDPEDGDDPRQPYLRRRSSAAAATAGHPDNLAIDPLALASQFDKSFRSKLNDVQRKEQTNGKPGGQAIIHDTIVEEDINDEESAAADDERADGENEDENRTVLVQSFHAQPGQRIAVPVRIEPKVIFANERTFMKWLHFSVVVGSVATALLNFTSPEDGAGLISAFAFTIASLACIAYSGGIFAYRAYSLRHRIAEGWYYDPYGPTVLCIMLAISIIVNLILRMRESVTGESIRLFAQNSVLPSRINF